MIDTPQGILISFDGLDSSGKHTQVRHLITRLRGLGHVVQHLESPDYTTPTGRKLKEYLQNKDGAWHTVPWEEKMKLFASNRAEKREDIVSALKRGEIVVYDRYVPSSLAFITVEALSPQEVDLFRDKIQAAVESHEYKYLRMPRPDISIFLDVPPLVATTLLHGRKHVTQDDDEYTDELSLQERLYNEYDIFCQKDPRQYLRVRCVEGDELLGIEDVAEAIWVSLREKFPRLLQTYAA